VTKIRVKLGAAEVEVEADSEHLREAIELVPALAAKLHAAEMQHQAPTPSGTEPIGARKSDLSAFSELPSITLGKSDSLADVIGKFFADPWGRERRKLSDVREALQSYGLNYPKQSVAVALLRLAKAAKIRRFKAEDGEYVYTVASPGLARPAQPREEVGGSEPAEVGLN
jgi:hypothetical protein